MLQYIIDSIRISRMLHQFHYDVFKKDLEYILFFFFFFFRLVVIVLLYLGIGSLYKVTTKQARGVEVIPNYDFWCDFPSLVKVQTAN